MKKKTTKKPAARRSTKGSTRKTAAPRRTAARRARAERRQPESLRLRSAAPGFTVDDIDKSLVFYRDILGFTVGDRWMQDGKLAGVELKAGSVPFMLSQDDWKKGRDRVKGEGFRIYCITVQDVDKIAARIRASGGALTQGPTDQPWGMRDLAVTDPDGFKITIANEKKKKK